MEKAYRSQQEGWKTATATLTSHQISVSQVSPSTSYQLWIFFFPQGCEKSMRFVLQTDHYDRESSAMKLI